MNIPSKQPFKLGYFYITHKSLLKKIAKYAGIAVVSLIWLNFFIQTIDYLTNINRTKDVLKSIATDYVNYRATAAPQNIIINDTAIFSREAGKYDLFARITNPNTYWAASELSYQFIVSGENIPAQTTSLLPGQEKFITQLNVGLSGAVTMDVSFKILDVRWHGQAGNIPKVDFIFEETQYLSVETAEESASGNFSRLTTLATNKSIYGFKDVQITVLLISQGKPVGTNVIYAKNFLSNEQRELEFIWPRKFPFNAAAEFNVETEVLNTENIITESTQ